MAIVEQINQVERGLDFLISQFKDKPVVVGFLTSFLEYAQELEDLFQQLNDEYGLEVAVGAQLDVLGIIVGVARQGRTDEEYRLAIKIQVAINTSDGTESKISAALRLITGLSNFQIRERYPAGIHVVFGAGLEEDNLLEVFSALDQIVAATILPSLEAEFELIFDTGDFLGVSQSPLDNYSVARIITGE